MPAVIDAVQEVFFVATPDEDTRLLCRRCGFRTHSRRNCGCPLCERGVGAPLPSMCTTDATCAQVTGLAMSATAAVVLDRAKDRGRASRASNGHLDLELPEGLELRSFQKAAVTYARRCFERGSGVIIGDDMGLGKTPTSIALAMACSSHRVLVVCPASLRLNWVREIAKWTSGIKEHVLAGGIEAHVLETANDVFSGPGWAVTNADRLIARKARNASAVVEGVKMIDQKGSAIKRVLTKLRAEQAGRAVVLWIAPDSAPKPDDVPIHDAMPASLDGIIIVRAPTNGHAVRLAFEHDGWTHVVAARSTVLDSQERGKGLFHAVMDSQPWDLLIVDEVHRFGNEDAANTRRVFGVRKRGQNEPGLIDRATHAVALTGTPIPGRPKQLLPLARAICPAFRESGHFLMRYCGPEQQEIYVKGGHGETKKVWTFDGGSHLGELQARLRRECMIRRKKDDVLTELPPRTRQIIPVSDDKLERIARDERQMWLGDETAAEAVLAALVADAVGEAFDFSSALDRLADVALEAHIGEIAAMRQRIAMAKLPAAIEHIETILTAKDAVVVMAYHRAVVEALAAKLPDSVLLYGGMSDEEKQASVDAFQAGKARVFVGSIRAAGVGLTLTAADTMVFVEHDWDPSAVIQAEDRIHRIGQTQPVLIQHIVADGTIEALIVRAIIHKQRMIDRALDAPSHRRTYPVCIGSAREVAAGFVAEWVTTPPAGMSARTLGIVREIARRLTLRGPTDGEVWLIERIATDIGRNKPT